MSQMQTLRNACRFDPSDGHVALFRTTKTHDTDLGRDVHGFPSSAALPL